MHFSTCVKISLKSMQNNKTPDSIGLLNFMKLSRMKSFFFFLKSLKQVKENGQLRFSQRQTVIKLIDKKIEVKGTLKIGDQYHHLRLI